MTIQEVNINCLIIAFTYDWFQIDLGTLSKKKKKNCSIRNINTNSLSAFTTVALTTSALFSNAEGQTFIPFRLIIFFL